VEKSLRTGATYVFGGFRLDPVRRTLTRDGVPIALSSRVFDTLLYLVGNAGRLVEKDELINAVWAGRYVEESNLSQTVFVLRKALKDAGEDDTLIATISGQGYRFTAPVQSDMQAPRAESPAAPPDGASWAAGSVPDALSARSGTHDRRQMGSRLAAGIIAAVIVAAGAAWLVGTQHWFAKSQHATLAFNPPPRSVAVLAFTNMSGDTRQDYLADGLSEELINELSSVAALHVAARTSAFYFKDHPATVADIARQLNVGAVLEGSLRSDGRRLRITAQLINATTGYQFWSRSYDRNLADILKLETEIAEDVTRSLQVTLQAADRARSTMGGTQNAAALDAFLRGVRAMNGRDEPSYRAALAAFDEAIRLDPRYAAAHARRAAVLMFIATLVTTRDVASVQATLAEAMDSANRAVALAPNWGVTHSLRGSVLLARLDLAGAERELQLAKILSPDSALVDRTYAFLEAYLGHDAAAEAAAARVITYFPAEAYGYADQGEVLHLGRRYRESLAALKHASVLAGNDPPEDQRTSALDYLALGEPETARELCAANANIEQELCLAIAAQRLGRRTEAEAALAKIQAALGDNGAYRYAEVFAQWGDRERALTWLDTAYKLHDSGLNALRADPLLDPIRQTPRFAEVERQLNFPP
jgi:TolB-like protein/DNA-binding winged helix-turn-helix (wHTH) protein